MEYRISNEQIKVVISSKGAEMKSMYANGREYLWSGDARYWNEQAPVLFPYVGRLTDGKYTYQGKTYRMNIHGFARAMEYKTKKIDEGKITFILEDSLETYEQYPFHFRLNITYALKKSALGVEYRVENTGGEPMYFGIGGHPGFAVPMEENLDFSEYYLEFSQKQTPKRIGFTEQCYLSGQDTAFSLEKGSRLFLSHAMFDEDAIVLKNMADRVTLKSDKGERFVSVSYPDMAYLGFWHAPHTQAPYICIEPWASLPSRQDIVEDLEMKSDCIRLEAGKKYVNQWEITVG